MALTLRVRVTGMQEFIGGMLMVTAQVGDAPAPPAPGETYTPPPAVNLQLPAEQAAELVIGGTYDLTMRKRA